MSTATAATEREPAPRTRTRPALILRALADSPEPLSTPGLVDLLGEGVTGRRRVLAWYGDILRRLEVRGRVRRAGIVPGARRRAPAQAWAVTDEGRAWLAGHEDAAVRARAAREQDMLPQAESRVTGLAARELREKAGRPQWDVAAGAGFAQSTLCLYERGLARIPFARAEALARALGTTAEALAAGPGGEA
jgi:hypothetical protein